MNNFKSSHCLPIRKSYLYISLTVVISNWSQYQTFLVQSRGMNAHIWKTHCAHDGICSDKDMDFDVEKKILPLTPMLSLYVATYRPEATLHDILNKSSHLCDTGTTQTRFICRCLRMTCLLQADDVAASGESQSSHMVVENLVAKQQARRKPKGLKKTDEHSEHPKERERVREKNWWQANR